MRLVGRLAVVERLLDLLGDPRGLVGGAIHAIEAANLADRVEIRVGPADKSLEAIPEEPTFDFVFIDADKTAYPTYYDLTIPRLKPGGLLLLDNVLLRGAVVTPSDERTRTILENQRETKELINKLLEKK